MAKRNETEPTSDKAKPKAITEPQTKSENSELPTVESPSISPAEPAPEPVKAEAPAPEPVKADAPAPVVEPKIESAPAAAPARRFLTRRRKRHALLAASVVLTAGLGVVIGVAAGGGFAMPPKPHVDTAAVAQQKALQRTIAKLDKEIAALKANVEAVKKSAHTQIAKITERFDRAASEREVTGSILPPQTVPAASAPPQAEPAISAPQTVAAPLPPPRPPQRVAAAVPVRMAVVPDWSIRAARDGFIYVQGHGEVYQVVPGAPLPGLGPVESIKRMDGRWMVTTPKGIIVSMRDRAYFESF